MSDLFTRYRIAIRMANKIMGGTPKDPKVIEGWIKSVIGADRGDEMRAMVLRTMMEMGHDIDEGATTEQLDEAIKNTAGEKSTNGFKRDEHGLYIEGRQIKAMLGGPLCA